MMNSEDGKMNSQIQHINLIQSLNVSKLDDTHISFIEDLILKDLNTTCIQNIYHMILPLALSWAEYDSPVKLKLLSCKILGESISNIDDGLVLQRHVLPITQYLLQDTQPQVRSSVCRQLPNLLCKVDQLSENLLLTSLLDAAQDSSADVRCAVLDVLIESEPYIYKGYIKDLILPTLKKLLESCLVPSQDEFLLHVCKLYSRLCNTYKGYMEPEDRAWFVSHFSRLCQQDNESLATFLSSSIVPMMLFVDSAPDLCQVLVACVLALSTSPFVSVRQILSSTLLEIVKTCEEKSRKLLLDVLVILLQEKLDVFSSLIPSLYSLISTALGSEDSTTCPQLCEKLVASLRVCEETISRCYKWRLHVLLMQEIQRLVELLSASRILEQFQEILFTRIKKSRPIPSRLAASKTLLLLLTLLNNDNITSKCISRIHKDLYCSRSFYDRNLFVKICHQTIQMLSFEEFKKYFLPSLILLSADPVANIRYSVTSLLVHSSVRLMSHPDTELGTRVDQCLGELKSDHDVDVSAHVNSLVSKLKEKRASALLNLLIEPALVVAEDLVDQVPEPSPHSTPSRSVIIHPYMKASMEKEFLIDAGIPFNSTPMSENYVHNKNITTESVSNINLDLTKPHRETPPAIPKKELVSKDITSNGTLGLSNKYDSNGNLASNESPRARSKLGIPKTFVHHERFPSHQIARGHETSTQFCVPDAPPIDESPLPPPPAPYNDGEELERKVNTIPTLPPRTNSLGTKQNVHTSYLNSKGIEAPVEASSIETKPKNINELYIQNSNTHQSNYQNETSSSSTLRYQMFKPKNSIKENEPNQSSSNVNSNSPGSKLKRAFMNTLGHKSSVTKHPTDPTFSKEGKQTSKLFLGNKTKDTGSNQNEFTENAQHVTLEEPGNDVGPKSSPELKRLESRPLVKQQSLVQPSFHRSLFSPKDQKRKSIHVMESFQGTQKKYPECVLRPKNEITPPHVESATMVHSPPMGEENSSSVNFNTDKEKQSFVQSFQNKRKSMYQPSDRDSLLTTFFKGQTLKYQSKDSIERKGSVSSLNKEQSISSFLESKPEHSTSAEKSGLSQMPISNTLPRPQKFSYQNHSPNTNVRRYRFPEAPGVKDESRKSPEKLSNVPLNSQMYGSKLSLDKLHETCNTNQNTLPNSNEKVFRNSPLIEHNSPSTQFNSTLSDMEQCLDEKQYSSGTLRQPKINHLDLQNNEFVFYKNKNCSDVEIGHIDSPRNSFLNPSEQEDQKPSPSEVIEPSLHSAGIHYPNQDPYSPGRGNNNSVFYDQRKDTPKDIFLHTHQTVQHTTSTKPCAENDITQKILNLTNEVETIDQYLNLESNTATSNLPHCISPLKVDIKAPSLVQEDCSSQRLNTNNLGVKQNIAPTGIMKRSPNLDKKKVMFLNDKVVTPEECQRLSLNFEKELHELNSKIEEINEEIRIETLNLQQAKKEKVKNAPQENSSPAYEEESSRVHSNGNHQDTSFTMNSNPESEEEPNPSPISTHQILQHTPPPVRKNKDPPGTIGRIVEEVDDPTVSGLTATIGSENQVHVGPKIERETKPPVLYARGIPKTQPKDHTSPEYGKDNHKQDKEDQLEPEMIPNEVNDSRVFRESKLLKRHAHRRSYDERTSKIDFHGFTKKSDVTDGTNFNKHSTYRRSFDDKNYSGSSETLVTNLPPKVPVPNPVNSEQKKISNYQIFSDRRKNILENKSFTVRIGSRGSPQKNEKQPRDVSPSLSNSSNNSLDQALSQPKQIIPEIESEGKSTNQTLSESLSNTHDQRSESRTVPMESTSKDPNVTKVTPMIGKPRVSVSPLKYSSASPKKSIPAVYTKPPEQAAAVPQTLRYARTDTPEDQVVTLKQRSISPQTILEENSQKQDTNNSKPVQNPEVPWRRPMSRMQTPRSISQLIESQIPGLGEDSVPPPTPAREKSIPDIARNPPIKTIPTTTQIKTRLVSKSPTSSKMIQPRLETTPEASARKPMSTLGRSDRYAEIPKPTDIKIKKPVAASETSPPDVKKCAPSVTTGAGKATGDGVTKIIKVGPSLPFGYNGTTHSVSDSNDKLSDSTKMTTVTVRRTSSSGSNESLTRYHKSQGNLSKNSSESLTNRSEPSSEASETSSKIPGKKNFKSSKFSCLRSDQESFYKNCHMSPDERPRSCIIPNGIHIPEKNAANLKSISEENLQHNNRRASSAGAIPTPSGGGSKLPRRSIKF